MTEVRNYDGGGNNIHHPEWGRAGEPLLRLVRSAYQGGASDPSGADRPNPRVISNLVCAPQSPPLEPHPRLTDFIWAWGQFLDHELDLTPGGSEDLSMVAPSDDPDAPDAKIPFTRSVFDPRTGGNADRPRQQVNALSSYIDGANVYGADPTRAAALRRFDGSGKLKTSGPDDRPLPPRNPARFENAVGPKAKPNSHHRFFLCGDIRANEHGVLTAMHTLWIREHNRLCDELGSATSSDEDNYQKARRMVAAKMQAITYGEFLPALLGAGAIPPYEKYNPHVNATISNLFSTVCYRLGHSMLSPKIRLHRGRRKSLRLRRLFFRPKLFKKVGVDALLGGLWRQRMQQIDTETVAEIRSFLFNVHRQGKPSNMLLDLAALNIQRGRDHGIPSYNECRVALGLSRRRDLGEITRRDRTVERLHQAYARVDQVDAWIGGLAEDPYPGSAVGEFFHVVIRDQFLRLRDGDRFWYENDPAFSDKDKKRIRATTLASILIRNTDLRCVPDCVFTAGSPGLGL